jgi:hypothetical protein
MSAFRSTVVCATKVATRSPSVFAQAARPLSTSARLYKREVIAEREIPVSSYTPDARGAINGSATPQQYSIPVRPDPIIEGSTEIEEDKVYPLSRAAYERMPPTMQKMTVMGKVVIITG